MTGKRTSLHKKNKLWWYSGGVNDWTLSSKNVRDIEKLYGSMIKTLEDREDAKMFCIRCYGKNIPYLITFYVKSPF